MEKLEPGTRRDSSFLICLWRAKGKEGPSCLNQVIQEAKEKKDTAMLFFFNAVTVTTLTLHNREERPNDYQTLTNQTSYSSSQGKE